MEITPEDICVGDKGYEGDTEGAYVVHGISPSRAYVWVINEVTGKGEDMSMAQAQVEDWRWFRD